MLLLTMLCYLFFYTGRHNFGWAAKGMSEALQMPFAAIGWISACMLVGYAIGQFINGSIADRWNPKLMVVSGAYLSIMTNVAISFSDSFYTIAILWALNGYFQSMAWAPGAKIINNWWGEAERGKAFGFYTMSAGFSSVVTFLLSILLLQQDMDWRMLFRLPVSLLFVAASIFLIFVKPGPQKTAEGRIKGMAHKNENGKEDWRTPYKVVFRNRTFLMTCIAFGLESMARYGLIFWVPVHCLGQDWKAEPGNLWITLLLPVGMAIGALSFGLLSDTLFKKDRLKAIAFGMTCSTLIALLIYFSPSENIVLAAALMFLAGFFVYGPQSCFWALCPDILGNDRVATGIGIMNMFGYLSAAIGEPILGGTIDHTESTNSVFLIVAFICLSCTVTINLVRRRSRHLLRKIKE